MNSQNTKEQHRQLLKVNYGALRAVALIPGHDIPEILQQQKLHGNLIMSSAELSKVTNEQGKGIKVFLTFS